MLNVGQLSEGVVLDHIKAGKSMTIYHDLELDKLDCCVAIIKNARSNKMGRKDIIKVECPIDTLDLDILGFIDHNITVNIIKDGEIVEKKQLSLPKEVHNVIKCKNPRCITSIEQELEQIFILADPEKEIYRCKYCEEKYRGSRNKWKNEMQLHKAENCPSKSRFFYRNRILTFKAVFCLVIYEKEKRDRIKQLPEFIRRSPVILCF